MDFKVPSIHIFPLSLNVKSVSVEPQVIDMSKTLWLIDMIV